ncbi:MAG: hemerythrin domain-containing protein [Syntrophorhabdaceae bacterium]
MKRFPVICSAIVIISVFFVTLSFAGPNTRVAAEQPDKQGKQIVVPKDQLFQMLRQDHREVRQIFDRSPGAPGTVSPGARELLQQLRAQLVPHMIAEEKTIYAEMYKKDATREMAKQTVKEHQDIKRVMNELENMRDDEKNVSPRIAELRQLVTNHARNEETMLFRSARDNIDPNRLAELATLFQQEKQNAGGGRP